MEFNQLILSRLGPIFRKHNLHIVEQFTDYIKFKSERVVIVLGHDARDNSNSIEVGTREDTLNPLNNSLIKTVLNSSIKVEDVTPETFVNNLASFFEQEGELIINGNELVLKAVREYVYKESENYTSELIDKQNLDAANKAWQEGNYKDFIKYLDNTDKQKLPSSYELKYKMANEKLKK